MVDSVSSTSLNYNGISGMASGLDTESLVTKLMGAEKTKVESLKAQKQTLTWQQEAYQEVMSELNAFSSEFYDVLNSDTYMLSSSGSKAVSVVNANDSADQFVNMIVNSDALAGSHTINEISQLATAASTASSAKVVERIAGNIDLTTLAYPLDFSEGTSFNITLDGTLSEISLSGNYADTDALLAGINDQLDAALGAGRVVAALSNSNTLTLEAPNSVIQVTTGSSGANFLEIAGMTSGARNILNLDQSVATAFEESAQKIEFEINDVLFSFDSTTTVRDVINEINGSKADVNLSYSTLSDGFTLTSKQTGASSVIDINNISGNFFGASSYININSSAIQNGQDAVFYLDDPSKTNPIKRSSNSYAIDGVSFSLKGVTSEKIDYKVEQNSDGIFDKISNYVSRFNDMMTSLHTKLNEKVEKDYHPLTEDQKAEMTEKQIELWEEKAKSGLLRNDSSLMKLETDLKKAFWDTTSGIDSSLYKIGITTSSNYNTFAIEIDETKLKAAISNDVGVVLDLFNKEEDISYSATLSSAERATRYQEVGFAQRISDILKSNTTTIRDSAGLKGILVEKAGVDGDTSEVTNALSTKLSKMEDKIATAIEKMNDKEKYYWSQFTAMETAIQQMNAQSDWLYQQFSQ